MHKSPGYAGLAVAAAAIVTGLWTANGPRWMWLALALWWACLVAAFAGLQRRGRALDTYQAIWGPDPRHPGNARRPIGWGIRRRDPAFPCEHTLPVRRRRETPPVAARVGGCIAALPTIPARAFGLRRWNGRKKPLDNEFAYGLCTLCACAVPSRTGSSNIRRANRPLA